MVRGRINAMGCGAHCAATRLYGMSTARLPLLVSRHSSLQFPKSAPFQQNLNADRSSSDKPVIYI